MVETTYLWRGVFTNDGLNELHEDAFGRGPADASAVDWVHQFERHSLGWVTARREDELAGFVNLPWDGLAHAWIQDEMVSSTHRRRGIEVGLLVVARAEAKAAGCEWLHVDFDDRLGPFYIDAAGFMPTSAGLIDLTTLA